MPISSGAGRRPTASQQQQQRQTQKRAPLQDANSTTSVGRQSDEVGPRKQRDSSTADRSTLSIAKTTSTSESYKNIRRKYLIRRRGDATTRRQQSTSEPQSAMNSIGGQLVVTGANQSLVSVGSAQASDASSKQPNSMPDKNNNNEKSNPMFRNIALPSQHSSQNKQLNTSLSHFNQTSQPTAGKHSKLSPSKSANQLAGQFQHHNKSLLSLNPSASTSTSNCSTFTISTASQQQASGGSSTANLHHQASQLHINRRVNLKYIKTLIVSLLALDLLITVFVHQFSTHDELSLKWFSFIVGSSGASYKLRLSLLNLLLSSVWFVLLIGAIIFDVYFILLLGCLVDILSFVVLLSLSIRHFTQQIDYNTVNLTSLLLLLFSIIILHVYLLVMATLTTYLAMAVKQRNKLTRR